MIKDEPWSLKYDIHDLYEVAHLCRDFATFAERIDSIHTIKKWIYKYLNYYKHESHSMAI